MDSYFIKQEYQMSHLSPSTFFQHNTMSDSSELRPLYQLTSVKEETSEEELNSLSSLAEKAFSSFSFENVMIDTQFMPTCGGKSAHIGHECPINCPCVCHLPSSFPFVNEYRPSVIMAPVAREYRASTLTHFPLMMQTKENLDKPSSRKRRRKTVKRVVVEEDKKTPSAIPSGQVVGKRKKTPSAIPLGWTEENLDKPSSRKRRRKTVNRVVRTKRLSWFSLGRTSDDDNDAQQVVEERKKTPSAIPSRQIEENLDKPSSRKRRRRTVNRVVVEERKKTPSAIPSRRDNFGNDSDDEGYIIKVNIDGQTAKFELTKQDWDLMDINKFPSGGRLLGGAWATIVERGVKQSNHWCNLRLKNNHVRAENSRKRNSAPFFRGDGECKRPECKVKFKFVIHEERGKYVHVTYEGNVFHKVRESYEAKK